MRIFEMEALDFIKKVGLADRFKERVPGSIPINGRRIPILRGNGEVFVIRKGDVADEIDRSEVVFELEKKEAEILRRANLGIVLGTLHESLSQVFLTDKLPPTDVSVHVVELREDGVKRIIMIPKESDFALFTFPNLISTDSLEKDRFIHSPGEIRSLIKRLYTSETERSSHGIV